jgi:hypothetical protein
MLADSQSRARVTAASTTGLAASHNTPVPCEADSSSPSKTSRQMPEALERPCSGACGSQMHDSGGHTGVDRWAKCSRAAKDAGTALLAKVGADERPVTPTTRLVQSARPISPGEPVLDPTVWTKQAMQRPPSRQKPPPEALHLFSQDASMWEGEIVRRKGRPQTALGTTRRSDSNRLAVPCMQSLTSMQRPVSRHRPPPESLDLRAAAVATP